MAINATKETCERLVKSQVIGEAWRCLEVFEVIKWQALNKYMYRTAVSRIQTKIRLERGVYFLRLGTNVVDEVRVPSGRCFEHKQDFDIGQVLYCQFRSGDIFYADTLELKSGLLVRDGFAKFRRVAKADTLEKRVWPAICNYMDTHIFVMGGYYMKSVERYDPATDVWQRMPLMNVCRVYLASVALREHVYAICGWDGSKCLNSIERRVCKQVDSGAARW